MQRSRMIKPSPSTGEGWVGVRDRKRWGAGQ